MKSITKLMVVAMLLVAALVVAPAAAREVGDGDNVYIGEKHADLSQVFGYPTGALPGYSPNGTLVYYSSVATPTAATIGKTIPVTDATDFELTAADFSSTGAWYAFNKTTVASGAKLTDQSAADGYILVEKPSTSLAVKLWQNNKMTTTSVKEVTRDSEIAFEIKHNIRLPEGVVNAAGSGFNMQIEVITPDGAKLTTLAGEPLKLNLTGTSANTTGIKLEDLKPGVYTVQAKWGDTDVLDSTKPDAVTFEVRSKALSISATKDSVVRGNDFSVDIVGESKKTYYVFVKGADSTSTKNPMIIPDQTDVSVDQTGIGTGIVAGTNASVKTDGSGKATIGFNTTKFTDDKTFTIRVKDPITDKTDDVKVKVETGSVTITTSGTGTYYIGEEITLSGTCTEGDKVFFFLTGPNFDANGVNLTQLRKVDPSDASTFESETVEADDTWSHKWNTADLITAGRSIDAGGYTIYAVSHNVNKAGLSDHEYATASINLRTGFLTATTSGATVAKGDKLVISGTAQGNPDNVLVWIFGKNYYGGTDGALAVRTASVESDNSFEVKLESSDTDKLAAGQYFVVVQHPMGPGTGSVDVNPAGTTLVPSATSPTAFNPVTLTGLQAPAAASALINVLDSPNIPDTYVKLTFFVDEPIITVDSISTKEAGSKFTITGTTNLAAGGILNIEVTSAAFQPGVKTEASGFSSIAGTAVIEKGDGMNKWSYEVDATGFKPDQYIVNVESIDADTTTTTTFDMVEATEKPTTPPAGEVTTPPAGEVTTPPAAETTTEPAPTPGFGALVALAGLGAVAFLVLRRK